MNNWCGLERRVKWLRLLLVFRSAFKTVCWARLPCFSDFSWNLKCICCPRVLMSADVYNPIMLWNVERLIDSLIHGLAGSNADVSLTTDTLLVEFRVHLWSEVSWNLNYGCSHAWIELVEYCIRHWLGRLNLTYSTLVLILLINLLPMPI